MTPTRTPPLVTVPELARRWRVSAMTVYRLCAQGVLPSVRVGRSIRVRAADVDAYEQPSRRSGATS